MKKKKPRKPDTPNQARVAKLYSLIKTKQPISAEKLMEELEVSRATLRRDFDILRDRLNMPLVYDRATGGYSFAPKNNMYGESFELPGLWLNRRESYALLTLVNVLKEIDPGLLTTYVMPLRGLLKKVLHDYRMMGFNRKIGIELGDFKNIHQRFFSSISCALENDSNVFIRFIEGADFKDGEYWPERLILTPNGWDIKARIGATKDCVRFPASSIISADSIDQDI